MLDEAMASQAMIQYQDASGVWRTVGMVVNNSQYIIQAMSLAQTQYPNKRVRAIDSNTKSIIDIL
jgi:hypothetical protein